jgi:hypothetical protein
VNLPHLPQLYDCISAQLMAADVEQWEAFLSDPAFRAFLATLYRLALADDEEL